MDPIRILLADDHTLMRAGIRLLLQNIEEVQVVGEASDGHEALRFIRVHRPDVVLMDIGMSGMNGLEATVRISRDFPDVRVIILSMHAHEEYVHWALRAGVAGYLLKDAMPTELELAIKAVAAGHNYLSPAISNHVVQEYRKHLDGERSPLERLTSRQREILQLIAEGHTTKEIAQKIHLSIKTVETHRTQLMKRLDIHDIPGLVRFAVRMGLVTSDQ